MKQEWQFNLILNLRINAIFDEFRTAYDKLFTLTKDIPQLNIPDMDLVDMVSQALVANWLLAYRQVLIPKPNIDWRTSFLNTSFDQFLIINNIVNPTEIMPTQYIVDFVNI